MKISVSAHSLILLIGVSGSGKSTFAGKHFLSTQVISSDTCRAMLSDQETCQEVTKEAFELLHFIVEKRLSFGLLTVVDATNLTKKARSGLITLAKKNFFAPVALVLDLPASLCYERNSQRQDRQVPGFVIRQQLKNLEETKQAIAQEPFSQVYFLQSAEQVAAVQFSIEPLECQQQNQNGPFDILGDVHGCFEELYALLNKLGYHIKRDSQHQWGFRVTPPQGRRLVFVGDLVDRGPENAKVLRLVMSAVADGVAWCVIGNHDDKLMRALQGNPVKIPQDLEATLAEIREQPESFQQDVVAFLQGLACHYLFAGGKLLVAHAGLKEKMHGRFSPKVRAFCLYGDTTGEVDKHGLPVRKNWAYSYRGKALVVYGHTPVDEAVFLGQTVNIDTGCAFGGKLTAFRYPERELCAVAAKEKYSSYERSLQEHGLWEFPSSSNWSHELIAKEKIHTYLFSDINLNSNCLRETDEILTKASATPREAMAFANASPPSVYLQGSQAIADCLSKLAEIAQTTSSLATIKARHLTPLVVVLCKRHPDTLSYLPQIPPWGVVYTENFFPFFGKADAEKQFLQKLHEQLSKHNWWQSWQSDWFLLQGEILPLSLSHPKVWKDFLTPFLTKKQARKIDLPQWVKQFSQEPKFHLHRILASEGQNHLLQEAKWHHKHIAQLVGGEITPGSETIWDFSQHTLDKLAAAQQWWQELFSKEIWAIETRATELHSWQDKIPGVWRYLNQNFLETSLAVDKLVLPFHSKSLFLKESALAYEALTRFVEKQPPHLVYECILAMQSLPRM